MHLRIIFFLLLFQRAVRCTVIDNTSLYWKADLRLANGCMCQYLDFLSPASCKEYSPTFQSWSFELRKTENMNES
jgi:hypothetical protein